MTSDQPMPRRAVLGAAAAGCAGAGVALLLRSTRPTSAPAPLPSSRIGWEVRNRTADVAHPLLEVEPLRERLQRLRATGAGWVRLGLPLWVVGNFYGPGGAQWFPLPDRLDLFARQVDEARRLGLKVSVTLTEPRRAGVSTNDFFAANRRVLSDVVDAVGSRVQVWQVMNEPDLSDYRHGGRPRPGAGYWAELDAFLAIARSTIRAKAPDAVVTTSLGGAPSDAARWRTWAHTYAALTTPLDAWGVNAYPGPQWREEIDRQGDHAAALRVAAGRPVIVFETGMPTASPEQTGLAQTALPAMVSSLARGADVVLGYQLDDQDSGSPDREMHFGLYRSDGTPKPFLPAVVRAMTSAR